MTSSRDDRTKTTVTLLGVECPTQVYLDEHARPVCSIGTDGLVQKELERRVADLITERHAERVKYDLPIARGPIQTAMGVQREITDRCRIARIIDSGVNYYCPNGKPEYVVAFVDDLATELDGLVRRWMVFP